MKLLGRTYLIAVLVFLYTPILVMMAMGFNASPLYELPFTFSTRWYSALMSNTTLLTAGANSIIIAIITAVLATTLGTMASVALSRSAFRGKSLLQLLLLPPIAIPWLITGTAMLIFFYWSGIGRGMHALIIGHVALAIPYVCLLYTSVLFNDGKAVAHERMTFATGFHLEIWSCDTGDIATHAACATLTVELNPQELRCLRLTPAVPERWPLTLPSQFVISANDDKAIILGGSWEFRFSDSEDTHLIAVDRGWHDQGFAKRSGTGIYQRMFELTELGTWSLELPAVHTAAAVSIDGHVVGRRAWSPYCFPLGKLEAGPHLIEISVSSTAANRYYADTPYQGDQIDPCGLSAAPRLIRLEP